MTKRDLVREVSNVLRKNGIKKPISIPKHVFHISDDDGNTRDFSVKTREKTAVYTAEDVTNIVDACICVIEDAMKRGEEFTIRGFGTLGLKYRKPRSTRNVNDGEIVEIAGHYIPKFSFGEELRMCARTYELLLNDQLSAFDPSYHGDDDEEEEGE
ncbi:MAG: HU family DNA-binding protein [Bacteroidales bacterium]|nr:HU family DNA-binding protein [Bacteroidales bacterium]